MTNPMEELTALRRPCGCTWGAASRWREMVKWMTWKCTDLTCVRKSTKSRSNTPCKQIQPLSRIETLNGPRVRGISPVGRWGEKQVTKAKGRKEIKRKKGENSTTLLVYLASMSLTSGVTRGGGCGSPRITPSVGRDTIQGGMTSW